MPECSLCIHYFPHDSIYEHSNFLSDRFYGYNGHYFFNGFQDHYNGFLPSFDEYDIPSGITLGGVNRYVGFGQNELPGLENLAGLKQFSGLNLFGPLGGIPDGLDGLGRMGGLAALGGLSRLGALMDLAGITGMRLNPLIVLHLGRRRKHGKHIV